MINPFLSCFLFIIGFPPAIFTVSHTEEAVYSSDGGATSIAFATFRRSSYAFDIYSVRLSEPSKELRLTDGESINFNGQFPSSASLSSLIPQSSTADHLSLVYVTERNGSSRIYLDALYLDASNGLRHVAGSRSRSRSRSILGSSSSTTLVQLPLVSDEKLTGRVSMKDRPSLVGQSLVYVSTHESTGKPRASWAAVYSTRLKTGLTSRLTPRGVADFSPAVSPSGVWTAVASYGEEGWDGDVQELRTDIYVFLTADGSKRVKLVEHGGWPSWADDATLYFHRKCDDGWWSVFRAVRTAESAAVERVTPPGFHAFTPAASTSDKNIIAIATRRPESEFRHIEMLDVLSGKFTELTRPITPSAHHYNPFISPDSARVGYHRCRGATTGEGKNTRELALESIQSPLPTVSLFRLDGSFPSFSPDGGRMAYVKSRGVYVMNSDGSNARVVTNRTAFSTAWDWRRKGVVYTSVGPTFASEDTKVDIISIDVDDKDMSHKQLTVGGENNAFPSPSPDGKWVVFRSGRSGHKNLYIMDAVRGEVGGLTRLTEGSWSDTMCNWSPDGEWIAFASDREDPGSGSFELFKIHPNGTGLRKLVQSGLGGRANHPWFSPDGKHIVFTSDYAGVSAEPISYPFNYQPYGDIFVVKSDGSSIRRLTHNAYEDGTPAWSPKFIEPVDVEASNGVSPCSFDDSRFLQKSLVSSDRQCGL